MKNTKRVLAQFTFFDRTGIQAFLEKQAQKGWLLDKISSFGWKFRRIEPQKINFAVTYFPDASVFDPKPSEKQQSFWEFCQHTGWKLAAYNAQLQVFYNEAENPIPIETDPQTELETIDKSAKKAFLPSFYLLTGCAVLQMALGMYQLVTDPIGYLSSNASLFSVCCWFFMLAMCLMEIVGYFSWRKKAVAAIAESDSFIATKGYRNIQLALMWIIIALFFILLATMESKFAIIAFISVAIVSVLSLSVWGLSNLLKKFNVSAATNKMVTIITTFVVAFGFTGIVTIIVFNGIINSGWLSREPSETYTYKGATFKVYDDQLPLMVEDLVETDYSGYSTSWYGSKSLLMAEHNAYQNPRISDLKQPGLQYTLVEIKAPFLYNFVHRQMLKDFPRNYGVTEQEWEYFEHAVEIPASEWGAECAYQIYLGDEPQNEYMLCYSDSIIILKPDRAIEFTPQAKASVGAKIGGVAVCY